MPAPCRRLKPLELANVTIADTFWAPRQETNRTVGIRHQYQQCKDTGRLDAFKLDWKPGMPNEPHIFWDSDVAKWVEAASYSLATHPDPELRKLVDDTAALIASAQQPDGYLNCHFTVVEPTKRWTNLRDQHELYCAGHLIEGAVAHFQATGSRVLLDALCRYADHIARTFGPEPDKKKGYPGHEEIELALIKLFHATGDERYLSLSKYFIDQRGQQPHYYDEEAVARGDDPKKYWARTYEYNQAHKPVREQDEAVGHAVRAMYLYSGMADVAAETGDEALLAACRKLWASAAERKMFLTGGVGSSHWGEKFTGDYELPNESAYAETCAAIGLVFFAHRMLQIEADAKYADVMEQALYNGVISGVNLAGTKFFYVNPLASNGGHHRQEWFGCACCPPNLARLVASLGSYVYSAAPDSLYVHLYVAGSATTPLPKVSIPSGGCATVTLTQETGYPWNGDVRLTVSVAQPSEFDLFLRIPGWCRKHLLKVNGKTVAHKMAKGYAKISRTWANGDRVELSLAMPVERVVAHPRVAEDAGKVALRRGPIVYCLEQADNSAPVRSLLLPDRARLTARFDKKLLGGVVVIEGVGLAPTQAGWRGKLYQPASALSLRPAKFRAIPYCLWDNREPGAMTVWLPRA
ncbi:MAG TPA: glycoside hydrolase family 127 protein [Planctomycetota bacterium]|nr:glycoside hydrolase family 127 protein [Planctomycetota bacterium]HRR80203.1 glycoside hydrolase family 127 protein [Planctomycetota bacterium]HRT93205.1 glycoside hydrolase family 127 protein [Planctomycetota bacterium]